MYAPYVLGQDLNERLALCLRQIIAAFRFPQAHVAEHARETELFHNLAARGANACFQPKNEFIKTERRVKRINLESTLVLFLKNKTRNRIEKR